MLVWGGRDDLSVLGTGGRYDVLTDTWTPMSDSGAPAGRRDQTAVWANGFLVVWGGQDDFSAVSSGGRYAWGQSSDQDGDGLSPCAGDCDDGDALVYPGAPAVCDGVNNDCLDPSWPETAGTNEVDGDGDGFSECQGDCNDQNGLTWAVPDEVPGFFLEHNPISETTILTWSPPPNPGTLTIAYDVLRSVAADDFGLTAFCLESDGTNTLATDPNPPVGGVAYYLVRAQSTCPSGEGTVGNASAGPRLARTCP
jgi:hypothetical protein